MRCPPVLFRLLICLALCAAAASGSSSAQGEEAVASAAPLVSGRAVGERVPQFYVRAVTGPLKNRSVCYVCRNGDRPVAMLLIREIDPHVPVLLKKLDDTIDRNRAVGLRGFGVLLSENQRDAVSKLQTMSYDSQLLLPLTVSAGQIDAPANQNVHPDAAVTVVLYRNQHVVSRHAFRAGELDSAGIERVMSDVAHLLPGSSRSAAASAAVAN